MSLLAAVLAILGYSFNESVVIFDRIRENFGKYRKASLTQAINNAINRQTMSRTIITHGSTQRVVIAILIYGGQTLHNFAIALRPAFSLVFIHLLWLVVQLSCY